MEKQKKKQKGITLIALVISIIVMLILAGVSLNMTIGENGIVTKAQEAKNAHELASDLEALQMALVHYTANSLVDKEEEVDNVIDGLFNQKLIDWADGTKDASGKYIDYNQYEDENDNKYVWVKKGSNSYRVYLNEDGVYTAEVESIVGGGRLLGGTYMVTGDAFSNDTTIPENERGKFSIAGETKVIFNEPLGVKEDGITASGDMLSIYVESGAKVKLFFYSNAEKQAADGKTYYILTNEDLERSAIDIESNGELDMFIGKNVKVLVDSGFGKAAEDTVAGKGGYAGIHVPEGATLTLRGEGSITANGGKAGHGSSVSSGNNSHPAAGGGGAGAGIGGNGGDGAVGTQGGRGRTGEAGKNCGTINIHGSIEVFAYGGAGGSGGSDKYGKSAGGGGGGYPGAGIGGGGGGGAGSTDCAGGGGYTGGGSNEASSEDTHDGLAGLCNEKLQISGGGYFQGGKSDYESNGLDRSILCLGGLGGNGWPGLHHNAGNGGNGGNGGTVSVSKDANVYAFNGNRFTNGGDYQNGISQCPIYLQNGWITAKYVYSASWKCNGTPGNRFTLALESPLSAYDLKDCRYVNKYYEKNSINKLLTVNSNIDILKNIDMSRQGVGSGAGYVESSNGTYIIYNENESGSFTTVYTGE